MIDFNRFLIIITRVFFLLSPFYYAIVFFEGHNLDEESFFIRAVKDILIVCLYLLWCINFFLYPNKHRYLNYIDLAVLLFIFYGILKLLFYDSAFNLTFLRFYIEYVLFYFISKKLYDSPQKIIGEIERIIIISVIVSIIGLIEYSFGSIETIYSKAAGQIRIISTLFNPNALGWYLTICSSLLIAFILGRTELKCLHSKFLQISCLFINTFAIFLTGSRSSLLILFFVFAVAILKLGNLKLLLKITLISITLMGVIFSLVDLNFGELRIFNTGLESERSLIFTYIFNFVQNLSVDQLIFGVSNSNLHLLKELALVFDSQIILDFVVGGLFIIFFKYTIVIYFLYSLSKVKFDDIRRPLFLFFLSFLLISILGNILMIFPHGIYFWYFLGVISIMDKFNHPVHLTKPVYKFIS